MFKEAYKLETGVAKIPEGTTKIENYAFCNNRRIRHVIIPDSVTEIGEQAFYDCSNLGKIFIPKSVTRIAANAFDYCDGLRSIVVEEGNPKYDSRNGCNALIETATNKLMKGCGDTIIPDGIEVIGSHAFGKDKRELVIPDGVKKIEAFAYSGNSSCIEIPASVVEIDEDAFTRCNAKGVVVAKGNPVYDSRNDCNAIIETKTNRLIYGSSSTIIPEGVTEIKTGAILGFKDYELIIPKSLTHFEACMANTMYLSKIVVAEGNPVYDSRKDCNALIETATNTLLIGCSKTKIPSGIVTIETNAFTKSSFKKIRIPKSVKTIKDSAFFLCEIINLVIPKSVTELGGEAFACCYLERIVVENGNPVYDSRNDCNAIIETATNTLIRGCCKTTIPDSVTKIGDEAFESCFWLKNLVIPEGVTEIGYGAFSECRGLENIIIPKSVTSIGDWAFSECEILESIIFYCGEVELGENTFSSCYIKEVLYPQEYAEYYEQRIAQSYPRDISYENYEYDEWNQLLYIIDPKLALDNLMCGGDIELLEPTELTCATIPEGVTIIDRYAFAFCENLAQVVIPESVKTIKNSAFYGCGELSKIVIPNGVEEIEACAFGSCNKLEHIEISATVKTIGLNAFSYGERMKTIIFKGLVEEMRFGTLEKDELIETILVPTGAIEHYKKIFPKKYHDKIVEHAQ